MFTNLPPHHSIFLPGLFLSLKPDTQAYEDSLSNHSQDEDSLGSHFFSFFDSAYHTPLKTNELSTVLQMVKTITEIVPKSLVGSLWKMVQWL
jgi:hypothetical protein